MDIPPCPVPLRDNDLSLWAARIHANIAHGLGYEDMNLDDRRLWRIFSRFQLLDDFARRAAGDLRDWTEVLSDPVRQSDCIEDLDGGITPGLVDEALDMGLLD